MSTPLRAGSKVHAGELAEAGFLGSPCRYKGIYHGTRIKGRIYVTIDGAVRSFREAAVHHEADCPKEAK